MLRVLSLLLAVPLLFLGGFSGQAKAACSGSAAPEDTQCHVISAQTGEDCAQLSRATDRLACWDRIHRLANCPMELGTAEAMRCAIARQAKPENVILTSSDQAAPSDPWSVRHEDTAFTETRNVFLSVASDGPVNCGARAPASLILRCLSDRTAVYVAHDCNTPVIGNEGWAAEISLDGDSVERIRMTPTQRGDGFGHFDYRPARTLIERLQRAETLQMRFSDIEGFSSEMTFDLTGLSDHLPDLTEACGWSEIPPWAAEGAGPETP